MAMWRGTGLLRQRMGPNARVCKGAMGCITVLAEVGTSTVDLETSVDRFRVETTDRAEEAGGAREREQA